MPARTNPSGHADASPELEKIHHHSSSLSASRVIIAQKWRNFYETPRKCQYSLVNSAQFFCVRFAAAFFTSNNHGLCLLLFKHRIRFKYFLKFVLWRFKVSLLKTKVVAELVTSPKQYTAFPADPNTSILLVLGSIASSISLDFVCFLKLVLWKF
ncbi:hypothetical protein [Methylobacter sp. YRD-M1]|uniref:hypothetical protein n=1 Tax=Methylobacter sp. YRD-M1 TaxID=2911520 RepID=UPI00227D6686|nr:hypothetical protein [Methylobacter sp. YRD-M1]WAK03788.1 hypothetical protein LZ558_08400 [Methylobacter sp. YRD-M1]